MACLKWVLSYFYHVKGCKFAGLTNIFSIYKYATVTTNQGALFIGGFGGAVELVVVACYNNAGWSQLDNLQSTRSDHRAIINGDKVYLIGGSGTR